MSVCIQCLMSKLSGSFWLYAENEEREKNVIYVNNSHWQFFCFSKFWDCTLNLCVEIVWTSFTFDHFGSPFLFVDFGSNLWREKRWKKRNRKKTSLKEAVTQAKVCLAAAIADVGDRFHTKQTFWKIQSFRSLFLRVWVSLLFFFFHSVSHNALIEQKLVVSLLLTTIQKLDISNGHIKRPFSKSDFGLLI